MEASSHLELPPFCRAHGWEICFAVVGQASSPVRATGSPARPTTPEPELPPVTTRPQPPEGTSVGVAVIDEDAGVRALMKRILKHSDEFHSSGFFATAPAALAALPDSDARILLVHLELPGDCGIRCAIKLKRRLPWLNIIVTARQHSQALVQLAVGAGIGDYLARPLRLGQTLTTLRFVAGTQPATLATAAAGAIAGGQPLPPKEPLNAREESVLVCLDEGLSYKEIADRLNLPLPTVRKTVYESYVKLDAHNKIQALKRWRGRTPPPHN